MTQISYMPHIRAYLGGSFDPVHCGHLQLAHRVYQQLLPYANKMGCPLSVSLLPTAGSPFKHGSTNSAQRLAMLKLATKAAPLKICTHELGQTPPVYTINTLRWLRQTYANDCLIFIMGADSANSLTKWYQWQHLTDYVHLWIFNRLSLSSEPIPSAQNINLPKAFKIKQVPTIAALLSANTRCINTNQNTKKSEQLNLLNTLPPAVTDLNISRFDHIYIDNTPIKAISSSEIRQKIGHLHQLLCTFYPLNKSQALNSPVYKAANYTATFHNDLNIHDFKQIQSIKQCLQDWLPRLVYQYIMQQGLYSGFIELCPKKFSKN